VGDPHLAVPSIHVAGTNGKGTVCHMVEAALRASGLRTALYTSPHLLDFRERVRLDGEPISEDALLEAATPLWPAIEASGATFFEATTAIAFHAIARARADVAVVEVGLGGRLDATNVIDPEVCAITRIDLDHAAYLGHSLEEIAGEKAGILKPGVPVAIAARQEPRVWPVLRARAREVGAPITVAEVVRHMRPAAIDVRPAAAIDVAVTALGEVPLRPALPGAHHLANAAVAAHALALLPPALRPEPEAIAAGIAGGAPPGRFQRLRARNVDWILDVAHNPAGMAALAAALAEERPRRPVVALVGIVADKDWRSMLVALAPAVDHILLTAPPGIPPERRWDPAAALAGDPSDPPATRAYPSDLVSVVSEFDAAMVAAARRAATGLGSAGPSGTVLVAGSFHTVATALRRLSEGPAV